MLFPRSPLPLKSELPKLVLPLASESVSAGFPSPADDYSETRIDLNEHLIDHPISTFFLRVNGDSMINAGIHNGDLLIVDRSLDPTPGQIVVAILDDSFTLKRLAQHNGLLYLEADNPNYPRINLRNYGDVQIWGVAMHCVHSLNKVK